MLLIIANQYIEGQNGVTIITIVNGVGKPSSNSELVSSHYT